MEMQDQGEAPGLKGSDSNVTAGSLVPFDEGRDDKPLVDAECPSIEKEGEDLSDEIKSSSSSSSVSQDVDENCKVQGTAGGVTKVEDEDKQDISEESDGGKINENECDDDTAANDNAEADNSNECSEMSEDNGTEDSTREENRENQIVAVTTEGQEPEELPPISDDDNIQTPEDEAETNISKNGLNENMENDCTTEDKAEDMSSNVAEESNNQRNVECNEEEESSKEDTGTATDNSSDTQNGQDDIATNGEEDGVGSETETAAKKNSDSYPDDEELNVDPTDGNNESLCTEKSCQHKETNEEAERRARSIAAFQKDLASTGLSRSTLIKRHPEEFIRHWRDNCTHEETLVFFSHIPYYIMNLVKCDEQAYEGAPKNKLYTALGMVPKETVEINIMDEEGGVEILKETFEVNEGERTVVIARNERLAKIVCETANKRVKRKIQQMIASYEEKNAKKEHSNVQEEERVQSEESETSDKTTDSQNENTGKIEDGTEEKEEEKDNVDSSSSEVRESSGESDSPAQKADSSTEQREAENKPEDGAETEVRKEEKDRDLKTSVATVENALVVKGPEHSAFRFLASSFSAFFGMSKTQKVSLEETFNEAQREKNLREEEKEDSSVVDCKEEGEGTKEKEETSKEGEEQAPAATDEGAAKPEEKEETLKMGEEQDPAKPDSNVKEAVIEERDSALEHEANIGGRDACEDTEEKIDVQREEIKRESLQTHDAAEIDTVSVVEKKPLVNHTEVLSPEQPV